MTRLERAAGLALAALPLAPAVADTTIGQTGGNRGCFGSGEVADYNYVAPSGGGYGTSQARAEGSGRRIVSLIRGSADCEPDPSVGDTVGFVVASTDLDVNLSANLAAVTGPTSKADCKNGGWRNFGDTFKNQGQCMTVF